MTRHGGYTSEHSVDTAAKARANVRAGILSGLLQHREHVGRKLEQERSETHYGAIATSGTPVPNLGARSQFCCYSIVLSGASTVSVLLDHASFG